MNLITYHDFVTFLNAIRIKLISKLLLLKLPIENSKQANLFLFPIVLCYTVAIFDSLTLIFLNLKL